MRTLLDLDPLNGLVVDSPSTSFDQLVTYGETKSEVQPTTRMDAHASVTYLVAFDTKIEHFSTLNRELNELLDCAVDDITGGLSRRERDRRE